jgi:hypothetical protein
VYADVCASRRRLLGEIEDAEDPADAFRHPITETSVAIGFTVLATPAVFEAAFPAADFDRAIGEFAQSLIVYRGVEPIFLRAQLREINNHIADLEQADRDLRAVCVPSCEIAGCGFSLPDSIGCHCDDVCGKYGDCCSDYTEACPRSACEWEGTWYQGDNDGPMELDILLDENNDVSGTGDDEVGFFTLEGWATQMNIHLTKQYVDNGVGGASHALVYAGVSADGLNYSGHWTVPGRNEEGTFDITAPDSFLCRAQALCTVDACGEQSEQGDCWCDEGCASYGDCCIGFDFEAEC